MEGSIPKGTARCDYSRHAFEEGLPDGVYLIFFLCFLLRLADQESNCLEAVSLSSV